MRYEVRRTATSSRGALSGAPANEVDLPEDYFRQSLTQSTPYSCWIPMQPIFLLKNSGNTRFDHGAHGACFMIARSTAAHLLFTARVRRGARFSASIMRLVL